MLKKKSDPFEVPCQFAWSPKKISKKLKTKTPLLLYKQYQPIIVNNFSIKLTFKYFHFTQQNFATNTGSGLNIN